MNIQLGTFKSLHILFGYRHRLAEGILHDLRQRYIGSIFGLAWAVLFPVLQLSIYAGLYAVVFKIRPSGLTEIGYVVLVFSGLVPLMAFNEALTGATGSLSANKSLLLNTVFPAELIPVRSAIAAHIPSFAGLLISLALAFATGHASWQAVVLVPVFWVLLLMFAIGLGWVLSLLTLVARDITQFMSLIIMLMFVLSPFAYTPEMVPQSLKLILYLNPLSYFVLVFQKLMCYGTWPELVPALGSAILGIGTFLGGFIIFQKAKYVFFDYA